MCLMPYLRYIAALLTLLTGAFSVAPLASYVSWQCSDGSPCTTAFEVAPPAGCAKTPGAVTCPLTCCRNMTAPVRSCCPSPPAITGKQKLSGPGISSRCVCKQHRFEHLRSPLVELRYAPPVALPAVRYQPHIILRPQFEAADQDCRGPPRTFSYRTPPLRAPPLA